MKQQTRKQRLKSLRRMRKRWKALRWRGIPLISAIEDIIEIETSETVAIKKDDIPTDSYRCAHCGEIKKKGWSDEEAKSELAQNFPGHTTSDCDLICDTCFQKFNAWMDGMQKQN